MGVGLRCLLAGLAIGGMLIGLVGCEQSPQENGSDLFEDMEDKSAEKRYDAFKDFEEQVEKGVKKEDIEKSMGPLRKALSDADSRVRYRAAKVLSKLDEDAAPAVDELSATLKDEDSKTRYYAAKALAKMGPSAQAATDDLIAALEDADSDVQYFAAKALGNVKADAAVEALEKAAEAGDAKLKEAANEALAKIRESG